jgi:Ribosomal protein L7/L12 C-terminal domain
MPHPLTDEQIARLSDYLFRGEKIQAIKVYRDMTGLGLKEAKDAVEDLERSFRASDPGRFTASPQGKGCLGVVIAGMLCSGLVIYAFEKWV